MKKKDEIKVCLVGSSGGHLTHLYMLKPFWKDKNRFWVTFDKEDARSLLEGEKVYPCYFPTNRSIKALIKNTKIAWDVLHKEKPDLIISCGAAVAVPFFYIGKMMGAKLVYRECRYKVLGRVANSDQGLCMLFDLEEAIMFTPKPQEYTDPLTGEMKKKQMKFFPDAYKNRIGKSYNDYIADHQMDVSKFYHGDYYLEEEVKTMRGKGIASRKKSSI